MLLRLLRFESSVEMAVESSSISDQTEHKLVGHCQHFKRQCLKFTTEPLAISLFHCSLFFTKDTNDNFHNSLGAEACTVPALYLYLYSTVAILVQRCI